MGAVRARPAKLIAVLVLCVVYVNLPLTSQEQLYEVRLVASASEFNLRGELVNIAISPVDPNVISFESIEGGNLHRLWWYNTQTRQLRQVTPRNEVADDPYWWGARSDRSINWCPIPINGKNWFLFVSSGLDGQENIYLGNTTDEYYLRLTSSASVDHHPRWAPDANSFVYVSSRSGAGDIYMVNNMQDIIGRFEQAVSRKPENRELVIEGISSGQGHVRLTHSPDMDSFPDWSPSGRYIVYQGLHRLNGLLNLDLFLLDVTDLSKPPINLTHNPWQDAIQPKWSYDQNSIAFYASPAGGGDGVPIHVYLSYIEIQRDAETDELISFATQGTIDVNIRRNNNTGPLWGPGSRSILYVKAEGSHTPILMYEKGSRRGINEGIVLRESRLDVIHREIAGHIAYDGAVVAFITYEDQDYKIYKARPGGGILSRRLQDIYVEPSVRIAVARRSRSPFSIGAYGFMYYNQPVPWNSHSNFLNNVFAQKTIYPYSEGVNRYELAVRISFGSMKPQFQTEVGDRVPFYYSVLDCAGLLYIPVDGLLPQTTLYLHGGLGVVLAHRTVDRPSLGDRVNFPFGFGVNYTLGRGVALEAQMTFRNIKYREAYSPYSDIQTRVVSVGLIYRIPNLN